MKGFSESVLNIVRYIGSIVLFVFAVALIVFFTPRYSRFVYEFKQGEPWLHENLISEIDFPLLKTQKDKEKEAEEIKKQLPPVYQKDSLIELNTYLGITDGFKELSGTILNSDSTFLNDTLFEDDFSAFLMTCLDELYKSIGIAVRQDSLNIEGGDIYLRTDEGIKLTKISDFLSPEKAAQVIENKLGFFLNNKVNTVSAVNSLIGSLQVVQYIKPNIIYDQRRTNEMAESKISLISDFKSYIKKGQIIVRKGDLISDDIYNVISSYATELNFVNKNPKTYLYIMSGRTIIVTGCLFMLFLFLFHFKKDILFQFRKTSFILSLVVIFFVVSALLVKYSNVSIYTIPFALIPIIIRSFYDNRLAIFVFLMTMILVSFIVPNSFEFFFLESMAGMAGIFAMVNLRRRGRLFFTAFLVFITYSIFYVSIEGVYGHSPMDLDWQRFIWFGFNALMILAAIPLTYLYEKGFGFLSDLTLMELTDTNSKVLRMIAEKAPGTFQHSLQVANLAEEAIVQIGGNPLLARAGALYHDLGKVALPRYFIENQLVGQNPHDELDQIKSAEIIKGHITYGLELAKKYSLPDAITDFIKTHHGHSRVEYFYRSYQQQNPNMPVDEDKFLYKGKLPFSRETAAVMMADAIEAASRSLKSYSESAISGLVDRIIQQQIDDKQLNEADITFRQISIAKDVFKRKIRNIYHSRIEYPK
ncbi:MAG: hypothetical protein CVU05_03775 [Bacteroidetes bacterium HGW-Bacteroidetes-21]|jgi:hypothetical protein|nr:MAG: hypothetical protein CVU05_03775 [Bacteroidetes bacterium HGW-Bacteroidetes-21]